MKKITDLINIVTDKIYNNENIEKIKEDIVNNDNIRFIVTFQYNNQDFVDDYMVFGNKSCAEKRINELKNKTNLTNQMNFAIKQILMYEAN